MFRNSFVITFPGGVGITLDDSSETELRPHGRCEIQAQIRKGTGQIACPGKNKSVLQFPCPW